jgi:hypothetical protein
VREIVRHDDSAGSEVSHPLGEAAHTDERARLEEWLELDTERHEHRVLIAQNEYA